MPGLETARMEAIVVNWRKKQVLEAQAEFRSANCLGESHTVTLRETSMKSVSTSTSSGCRKYQIPKINFMICSVWVISIASGRLGMGLDLLGNFCGKRWGGLRVCGVHCLIDDSLGEGITEGACAALS
eukprot:1148747-Pelagomonas_calceolata.AAC.6